MSETGADDVRAMTAAIGRNYDSIVYEAPASEAALIAPAPVLGLAGLYGCANDRSDLDVLDLGCGTGVQLVHAARQTRGRIVGVDISEVACARARERCAEFGDRVRIIAADFLELTPEMLGTFGLVYHVGIISMTPPAIQERILELIGGCLKPGGAALLTYYAGSLPLLRQGLHRLLRASVDPSLTPGENIRRARQRLDEIAAGLPPTGPQRRVLAQVLDHARAQPDSLFFLEALNHAFEVLDTPGLDTALRRHGVQFLNYMTPNGFGALPTSRQRALAADIGDFASGGSYRYGVFGKPDGAGDFSVRSPHVRWSSRLVPVVPSHSYDVPADYKEVAINLDVRVVQAHTQAALDLLGARPSTWAEITGEVEARLAAHGQSLPAEWMRYLEEDLIQFWNNRLVTPTWDPAPLR